MFNSLKDKGDDMDEIDVVTKNEKKEVKQPVVKKTKYPFPMKYKYDYDTQNICIDIGSGMMKTGFAGDDAPRAIFPSIVGRPKNPGIMVGMDAKDFFVGDEAQSKRGILRLKYPIEHGRVTDWGDFEKIIEHTFYNELRCTPEEHSTMLTESVLAEKDEREKKISIMFETFRTPCFYMGQRPVLSLYASGNTTGLMAGIGDTLMTVTPIYEGYALSHATKRIKLGGRDITHQLIKLIEKERGITMTTSAEREIVRDMKEILCFISSGDEKKRETSDLTQEYELPDGSRLKIGRERFMAPECIFNPSTMLIDKDNSKKEGGGFHENIIKSILDCEPEIHKDLAEKIVLWGGSTMFEGLPERLEASVKERMGREEKLKDKNVKILHPAERKFSSWIGASINASLSTFSSMWILHDEYDDAGPSIVHRKCF